MFISGLLWRHRACCNTSFLLNFMLRVLYHSARSRRISACAVCGLSPIFCCELARIITLLLSLLSLSLLEVCEIDVWIIIIISRLIIITILKLGENRSFNNFHITQAFGCLNRWTGSFSLRPRKWAGSTDLSRMVLSLIFSVGVFVLVGLIYYLC